MTRADIYRACDCHGHIMPSHAGTPRAKGMEAAGLLYWHPTVAGPWPTLTEPGWKARDFIMGPHPHGRKAPEETP